MYLTESEHGCVQFLSAFGAYFPVGLRAVQRLGLSAYKGTPFALFQCALVYAALGQGMYSAWGELATIKPGFLVKRVHLFKR